MTRRALLLSWLTILLGPPAPALGGDPRWLRAVAAALRMLQATGTRSEGASTGLSAGFSGTHLAPSRQRPPRVGPEEFGRVADEIELRGVLFEDRRRVDRNLWSYVDSQATLSDALHLDRQWGPEGESLARTVAGDIAHVETCRQCRRAYEVAVQGTGLACASALLGAAAAARRAPKPERQRNQGSTIPP